MKRSAVSVFMQNIRLALFGAVTSVGLIWARDLDSIRRGIS
jgi:hypothetical protein